jgi:Ser/Thr protein kinase RdoA (MazF antagonist)
MTQFEDSFSHITPDFLLRMSEEAGFRPTGEYTQLNSYENRVFDIKIEDLENPDAQYSVRSLAPSVIAKVYRPGRWDKRSLHEEHQFIDELKSDGFLTPECYVLPSGERVLYRDGFYIAFFKKIRGRLPQELNAEDLKSVGRGLARLHNVGARSGFEHRPHLFDVVSENDHFDMLSPWLPPELHDPYLDLVEMTQDRLLEAFETTTFLRIHGDAHRGNLLHTGAEFFFVDFDDCCMGPAVQDFWMLTEGFAKSESLDLLLSGYEELRDFSHHELKMIPYLRAYRMIQYSAWIARRWKDPIFPQTFPHFGNQSFWIEEMRMLQALLQPPDDVDD